MTWIPTSLGIFLTRTMKNLLLWTKESILAGWFWIQFSNLRTSTYTYYNMLQIYRRMGWTSTPRVSTQHACMLTHETLVLLLTLSYNSNDNNRCLVSCLTVNLRFRYTHIIISITSDLYIALILWNKLTKLIVQIRDARIIYIQLINETEEEKGYRWWYKIKLVYIYGKTTSNDYISSSRRDNDQ